MDRTTTLLDSSRMPVSNATVTDVLNGLLESAVNSIFRFMGPGSPYLSRATVEVRKPLSDMLEANDRQAAELAATIEAFGGEPAPRTVQPQEQYLAYLSLKFLLPKLADAKRLMIQRYENALGALRDAPREVQSLLKSHLAEHRAHLKILEEAAAEARIKSV